MPCYEDVPPQSSYVRKMRRSSSLKIMWLRLRTYLQVHIGTHDTQTRNNIEPATRCVAAYCPATMPTVQSNYLFRGMTSPALGEAGGSTRNNNLWITQVLLRPRIEPATRYTAAGCTATELTTHNTLPDPGIEHETVCPAAALATTKITRK
uniref:SFRICE_014764 n=1 Tax=Spodoptera frugiperda TaxID=7108 RepID=A0A2H1VGN4_SPOFR